MCPGGCCSRCIRVHLSMTHVGPRGCVAKFELAGNSPEVFSLGLHTLFSRYLSIPQLCRLTVSSDVCCCARAGSTPADPQSEVGYPGLAAVRSPPLPRLRLPLQIGGRLYWRHARPVEQSPAISYGTDVRPTTTPTVPVSDSAKSTRAPEYTRTSARPALSSSNRIFTSRHLRTLPSLHLTKSSGGTPPTGPRRRACPHCCPSTLSVRVPTPYYWPRATASRPAAAAASSEPRRIESDRRVEKLCRVRRPVFAPAGADGERQRVSN
jgi:hypothetical protein